MQEISILVCANKNPEKIDSFLRRLLKGSEVLIYVDNNDNQMCPFLNKLRIRFSKTINLQLYVNPPLNSTEERFNFLRSKCTGKKTIVEVIDIDSFELS
jgi:hypothetical protein